MTNPAEALDAIERLVYDIAYKRSVGSDDYQKAVLRAEEALTHLATLRQQVVELVAFREAHQWMDIETAPKDGTEILAFFEEPDWEPSLKQCCASIKHDPVCGNWYLPFMKHVESENPFVEDWQPTGWQPLPTPPAAEGGQGGG